MGIAVFLPPGFSLEEEEEEEEEEGTHLPASAELDAPTPGINLYSERQPRLYRIWDISQKFLLLMNNILIAGPQTSSSPEQLMAVLPNNALDPVRQPIFMGLGDETLTLASVKAADGRPALKLMERSIMDLYRNTEESLSFTFYSRTDGNQETCCFESAAFPGWFISTSNELNKPVGLSLEGGSRITIFYFERKR
ncbi:Interleukin-1 family member 10 [Varanus komodoensis]|nr:Interleukin-1 family member 10 [Varanus komodoensis]